MKKILFLFAFCLCSGTAIAADIRAAIAEVVRRADQATMSKDWPTLVDTMPPKLVAAQGGRSTVVENTRRMMEALESAGARLISSAADDPDQTVKIGNQVLALVPLHQEASLPSGRMMMDSYLLAVSDDGGETWGLMNAKMVPSMPEAVKKLVFPNGLGNLRLPPPKKPVLLPTSP